jgi:hypothetical protein
LANDHAIRDLVHRHVRDRRRCIRFVARLDFVLDELRSRDGTAYPQAEQSERVMTDMEKLLQASLDIAALKADNARKDAQIAALQAQVQRSKLPFKRDMVPAILRRS